MEAFTRHARSDDPRNAPQCPDAVARCGHSLTTSVNDRVAGPAGHSRAARVAAGRDERRPRATGTSTRRARADDPHGAPQCLITPGRDALRHAAATYNH